MKHGKKYMDSLALIDRQKQYDLADAIELVKQTSKAKFDETIGLSVKLGVDPRHADQQVRGAVVLPHGTGKNVKVLVFAKGEKGRRGTGRRRRFRGCGGFGCQNPAGRLAGFRRGGSHPDMMGTIGRIARILGPRGLMPNPKSGTVTPDVTRAINEIKAGKVEYRVDRTSIVNVPVGKASFEAEKLNENISILMDAIVRAKPAAAKGTYLRSVTVATTMGPGIKLNPSGSCKRD